MGRNLFEAVKESVTGREAAQLYGIGVRRNGMACCPFHDDKHPSMKVDARFHCFGCGADGDVIDLTSRLYNLSPKEAAKKLAQEFGLIYDGQAPHQKRYVRQKTEAQKFKEDWNHSFRVLGGYHHLLQRWAAAYSPKTPEENPHPRFMEAIQKKDYVGYLLDFFLEDSPEEQRLWIMEHQSEIANLERRVKIMADKPTNRERLQQITAGIEQGIKELFESEKYMRYLSVMSRFHRYSVNNTMLIYMQKPDATLVAGFNKWNDQFERHVKKGEHGITIIAPTPYKKKIEEMKRDPDTHAPVLDADGKAVIEEKEIEIPMFRPVKVFDVSQTYGKPLPELASSLSGNVQNYEIFIEALKRSAPVSVEFEAMSADTDGYFSSDRQRIAIRQGMSEVQTVCAAVHEIAHSKLHDPKKYEVTPSWKIVMVSEGGTKHDYKLDFSTEAEAEQCAADEDWRYTDENQFEWRLEVEEDLTAVKRVEKNRRTEEVEAESISYAVCQYYGIQTGENSFGYIASWSQGKELKELRASLETINKTSNELISDIDRHYKEICKERGIDLSAKQEQETERSEQKGAGEAEPENTTVSSAQLPDTPEQALDEYPMPDQEVSVSDMKLYGYQHEGMLPVSRERALELDAAGLTVYVVHKDNTESMVLDTEEIMEHGGLFGVDHEEWEQSPQFHEKVQERQEHQKEREQAFLSHGGGCFAIYQVSRDDPQKVRFMNLDWLSSHNLSVDRNNYDLIYTAPLDSSGSTMEQLEKLYEQFNLQKPVDFHSPSMSVSDIVAIKQDGKVSCHYCDRVGFTEIPGFLPDNPLKNTEMAVEDDYGMIDGIINNGPKEPTVAQLEQQARSGQPISLMELAAAAHREDRDKKKSIREQLKNKSKTGHKQTAPKKSAEREI